LTLLLLASLMLVVERFRSGNVHARIMLLTALTFVGEFIWRLGEDFLGTMVKEGQ